MKRLGLHTVTALAIACFAVTGTALAQAGVDQANDETTGTIYYQSLQTRGTRSWAQSFVPTVDAVGAVKILLGLPTGPLDGCSVSDEAVTVEILDSDFNRLGMMDRTVNVPGPDSSWVTFEFASAIDVTPGELHVLYVYGNQGTPPFPCLPTGVFSDDRYSSGNVMQLTNGALFLSRPMFDMFFKTYGPGGTGEAGDTIVDTKAGILEGSGVPGRGIPLAPGLDKPFNEKSRAADRAGRKDR